jgi:hypothetical protein
MDGPSQVTPEALQVAVAQDVQQMLEAVSVAVSHAPDGAWIEASEERVRDALAALRQQVFQKALQLKAQAAEAAFPPYAGNRAPV